MFSPDTGWDWFSSPPPPGAEESGLDLARAAARVFASGDGEALLQHLVAMTLRRCLGPESGARALRHLEGQRHLVLHLQSLIASGRAEG